MIVEFDELLAHAGHEVERVTWFAGDNSLYIHLNDYKTSIDDGESDEQGWSYYDGLIEDFIKRDGWEAVSHRTTRNISKWGKNQNNF